MLNDFSDDTIELERFRIDQAIRHEAVEKAIQIIAARGVRTPVQATATTGSRCSDVCECFSCSRAPLSPGAR